MLNNISWASYIIALSIFLSIYYAFVLIMYYRTDLHNYVQLLKKRSDRFLLKAVQPSSAQGFESLGKGGDDLLKHDFTQELLVQLQSIIKNAATRNFPKEEVLLALQLHLKQHAGLKDANYKETINNFIKAQCENYCSIHLSVEEERVLWNI